MSKPKRTLVAQVCYQQDEMGNGCEESQWYGGQWGVPKCHNPEHHKPQVKTKQKESDHV